MVDMDENRREGVGLEDYLRVLKDRGWVIGVCVVVVLAVVLVTSLRTTPLYSSRAEIIYEPTDVTNLVTGYQIFSSYDYYMDRTIETAIAVVGKNLTIAESVRQRLEAADLPGAELSAEELSSMVVAIPTAETNFVAISVTSTVAEETAAIANAFAEEFVAYRKSIRQALVIESRDQLQSELAAMTAEERNSDTGLLLQNRYEQLRIAVTVTDSDFKLLQQATVPSSPFTPQTKRDVVLAIVLALVMGVGLAFLLDYLDKRIKDEKTLERLSGIPVLVGVPVVGRGWRRRSADDRTIEVVGFANNRTPLLESFRTLRSTLQYFNVDGNLRKILITSGLPGEGKTVTTANLAISLAMSGKHVIVLEADLRRPMLHEYLGLSNDVGLSNLLAGASTVPGAMQLVPMDPLIPTRARKGEGGNPALVLRKNLYCVTSGPLPPNPSELLQSARMADIIKELEGLADYVLIDTPPVLPVSDAVVLAAHADAVILTAKLGSTTRDEMRRVRETLSRAKAHVIGVVAGGVKSRRGYYYRRGYSYQDGGYGY